MAPAHCTGGQNEKARVQATDMLYSLPGGIESVEYARRTLLAGFTTVRDVGSRDLLDVGLRNFD
jgi:hypothetical protein